MTVSYSDLLRSGAAKLTEAGVTEARYDARKLLLKATGFETVDLIANEQDTATSEHQKIYRDLIAERATRRPIAHIEGQTPFYGLSLKTDPRALIPRADSECVVDLALEVIPEQANWEIADLGTGTGALLAAILANRPNCKGQAVDLSAEALTLANENFRDLGLADRVSTFSGSWANWGGWATCDLLISNPPYIVSDVIATLEPEVRDHDPFLALDGGKDGLDAYREIIALASTKLKPGAHLVFEIGYDQKTAVSDLLIGAGFGNLQHRQDLGGQDRAIAATKS